MTSGELAELERARDAVMRQLDAAKKADNQVDIAFFQHALAGLRAALAELPK